MIHLFNIRVYGILRGPAGEVLVSDEYIRNQYFTKLPGGGMEYGEGTRDCLKREFMEEMSLEVEVGKHIYTTDFFQPSAFDPAHQIISIYYEVKPLGPITVPLRDKPFDFDAAQMARYREGNDIETFRFIKWEDFSEDQLSLPIDKQVARLLKKS